MRRKDILIISAIIIVIAFGTVLGIYMALNGNIFVEAVENVKESLKRTHYSNGWETAIVDRIVDDVPVPVGFTYIEGKQKNGLIIENNISKEKYMWIPKTEEVNEGIYEEIMEKCNLGENNDSEMESITKYDGFYIAIDEMLEGETIEVKTLTEEEKYELRLRNESIGETVETHLTTPEEMAAILAYNEKIENKIKVTNYKTLTLLGTHANVPEVESEEEKTEEAAIKHKTEEAYIPDGFTHVEGTKVATGFKIEDSNSLRFIWIPVENVENVKSEIINKMKEAGIEADTIKAYEIYKDNTESDEYNELKSSIKKYGGFYISEAELGFDENGYTINTYRPINREKGYVSNGDYYRNVTEGNISNIAVVKKAQEAFNKDGGITKEKAVEKSKELYSDSETVVSHLSYGLNYDAAILYLLKNNSKVTNETAFEDSTSIGKYSDSDRESLWYKENYLNGIFGLAGNLAEITQEQNGESVITIGGSWADTGNMNPIASRSALGKDELDLDGEGKKIGKVGFRTCLYIKETREENEDLENFKTEAKEQVEKYAKEKGYTNQKVYKSIIEYINGRIDRITSKKSGETLVAKGKVLIDQVVYHINEINKYRTDLSGEEYKTIKSNGIKEIENIELNDYKDAKGYYKNKDGKVVTLQDIVAKLKQDIDKIAPKTEEKTENSIIGTYVNYTPSGEANYEVDKKDSGHTANQTIKQDMGLKWRVLSVNDDGTVDLISDKPTADTNRVYIENKTGYDNSEEILDNICKTLYSNEEIGAKARSIDIDDIISKISKNYDYEKQNTWLTPYKTEKDGIISTFLKLENIEFTDNIYNELFFGNGYYYYALSSKYTYLYPTDKLNKREYGLQSVLQKKIAGDALRYTDNNGNTINEYYTAEEGSLKVYDTMIHTPVRPVVNVPMSALGLSSEEKTETKEDKKWTGKIVNSFAGGEGTEQNPYIIETPEQLAYLAKIVNDGNTCEGKYYKITNDLNLNNKNWIPIGKDDKFFAGNLDGGKHKIKGLKVEVERFAGLLGVIKGKGTVKNIIIESGEIVAKGNLAGGIAGGVSGDARIENCENKAKVTAQNYSAGGIVGWTGGNAVIEYCTNNNNVTATYQVGGIVGFAEGNTVIEECINNNKVTANKENAGGIVGCAIGKTVIKNCESKGEVTAPKNVSEIAGYADEAVVIGEEKNVSEGTNEVTNESKKIEAVAQNFMDTKPKAVEEREGEDYKDIWEAEYNTWKEQGKDKILKEAKTEEDAKNIATVVMEEINTWVAKKIAIGDIAENFYWTDPKTWDKSEIWGAEYGNWKNQAKANIINSSTVEEAEGKAKQYMQEGNDWIDKKMAVILVAKEFYHSNPKSWEGANPDSSDGWYNEYVDLKTKWQNKIINSIDEADAKSKVPLAWADIVEKIPETEGPKEE